MVITMIDTKYKIKSKKNDIFPFINGIIMVLFVIVTLYPVLNTLAISLNDGTDALRGGIYLWPRKFTWKNYTTVLHKDNLITGAYITDARPLIAALVSLAAKAIHANIVSRNRDLERGLPVLVHHHVCKRWNDPDIPFILGAGAYQQLLGICDPWNGKRI